MPKRQALSTPRAAARLSGRSRRLNDIEIRSAHLPARSVAHAFKREIRGEQHELHGEPGTSEKSLAAQPAKVSRAGNREGDERLGTARVKSHDEVAQQGITRRRIR